MGKSRTIAEAHSFGRLSVAQNGDAILQQTLTDGKRVISYFSAATQKLQAVTTGPDDDEPLLYPSGGRFVYIDFDDGHKIKTCNLHGARDCVAIVSGPGARWLLGMSPSGRQLAYASRDGLEIRLRLVDVPSKRVRDLGPISTRCRLHWVVEERFWQIEQSPDFAGWSEFDLTTFRTTGRREAVPPWPSGVCPEKEPVSLAPTLVARDEAEIWRVRRSPE